MLALIGTMSKCPFYLLGDKGDDSLSWEMDLGSKSIAGVILRKMGREAAQLCRGILLQAVLLFCLRADKSCHQWLLHSGSKGRALGA